MGMRLAVASLRGSKGMGMRLAVALLRGSKDMGMRNCWTYGW